MLRNPRTLFNEQVDAGLKRCVDYPATALKEDGFWHAQTVYKDVVLNARAWSKDAAEDDVLTQMFLVDADPSLAGKFCCKYSCFKVPTIQIDGKACAICDSFSYCKCECLTHLLARISTLRRDIDVSVSFLDDSRLTLYQNIHKMLRMQLLE